VSKVKRPTGQANVTMTPDTPAQRTAQLDPELRHHVDRLAGGEHPQPHAILGAHPHAGEVIVRVFHPAATDATVLWSGGETRMQRVDERGLFEARLPVAEPPVYRLRMAAGKHSWEMDDPYRFLPTLGELDLHLIGEGRHMQLWNALGSRVVEHQGVRGTAFSCLVLPLRTTCTTESGTINMTNRRTMREVSVPAGQSATVPSPDGADEKAFDSTSLPATVGPLWVDALLERCHGKSGHWDRLARRFSEFWGR